MTIAIISHLDCLLHDMGAGHPEQPARIRAIETAIKDANLTALTTYYEAPLATRAQLIRVHDPDYVDHIFKIAPQSGLVCLDPDTCMNLHSLKAALHAAGAVVLAVDLVMENKARAAFCNVRPPGHHAEKSRAMGFCIFNNVAVGVAHAIEQYQLKRIAIVDFDVHHGNGTQDIFQLDERVLFCSSFQHPFYPDSGADTNNHHIINIPLPAGTTGEKYRNAVEEKWLHAIDRFKPEMIFFSAGFDAHTEDEMAGLNLIESDYAWVTEKVRDIANQHCPGRLVSVLEGGYALHALGRSAAVHISKLV